MQNKKPSFSQESFLSQLRIINEVKFTHREIDIIAFLICGRAAKKIASFFSISPKTVENHTHNIMLKLGCNSRENIIDFIEKSDKLMILRKYYATLLAQSAFEKCLNEVAKLLGGGVYSCALTYWEEQDSPIPLINHLETSLKFAKIDVLTNPRTSSQSLGPFCGGKYVLYIIPENWDENKIDKEEAALFSKSTSRILFFLPDKQDPIEIFKDFGNENSLDHTANKYYYFLTFEILKKILSNHDLEKIIADFKKQYAAIEHIIENKNTPFTLEGREEPKKSSLGNKIGFGLKNRQWQLGFSVLILGVFVIAYTEFRRKDTIGKNQILTQHSFHNKNQKNQERSFLHSDLVIPTSTVLLDRSELIAKIDERFKSWKGIQTIALVGIGGAGKTTLARRYASLQAVSCIWEINAETKQTLSGSFEDLAQALSETEEDQKMLTGVMKIKEFIEREEKIVQFVKERLRTRSNWFLIYDNVEKFTDIQNHFPKDPGSWGQGRIILTTQDSNIENNKHINNTIVIGELNAEQKLSLFIKIMNNGGSLSFTDSQLEEAKKFLAEIPPFPLDISVAAYYLKATNTPYQSYLVKMRKYDYDFSNAQERILQEAGDDYTKTRYRIITVSLRHLIDTNQNFKDLLLFISLLDPQSIPRDLLLKCKQENIVDDFIYHIKKYSLIINKNTDPNESNSTFAVHRSTQAIILTYLTKTLNLEQNKSLIQSVSNILEQGMSDAVEKEDFAKMKFLHRHAEHLLSQHNLLNDIGRGSLSGELGCICYYLCYYPQAQQLLNLGISELNKNPGKNDNKAAHFLVYLGNVHRRLGDYGRAKELFERSIELYKKSTEPHTGMARACGYLGIVYESLGNFDKAKVLLEKSLIIHQKRSKNQAGHAWSLAHLGSVYNNVGDYPKARELYEKSLQIYKASSPDYVGAAWVCGDLGSIYAKLGDRQRAKDLLEESLTISRRHFFEDHIYVAHALVNLGIFYRETKEFEKAKNLLKKGLVVIEKAYGKEHAETGAVLKEIGKVFLAEGNLKIAENMMSQTYSIFNKIKHPDKYEVLEILSDIYQRKSLATLNKGEIQQAEHLKIQAHTYLIEAFKMVKAYFPEDSPHNARIQSKIKKGTS